MTLSHEQLAAERASSRARRGLPADVLPPEGVTRKPGRGRDPQRIVPAIGAKTATRRERVREALRTLIPEMPAATIDQLYHELGVRALPRCDRDTFRRLASAVRGELGVSRRSGGRP